MKRRTASAHRASVSRGAIVAPMLFALTMAANAANGTVTGVKKDEYQTSAPYAILVDSDNGTVLFEKAADTPTAPSSMAKLMTAEVVFNEIVQGRLKPD